MDRSDMTYINPEKRDHVYIGKFQGKSLCMFKSNISGGD